MAYPWECLLYLDGIRVPDRAVDAAAGPVALDGLTVSWGRDEMGTQPDPGTCAFDLWDDTGGAAVSSVVHAGSTVSVMARGSVHYPRIENVFPDPDWTRWAQFPPAPVAHDRLAPVGTPIPSVGVQPYGMPTQPTSTPYPTVIQPSAAKLAGMALVPYPIGSPGWVSWPDFSAWPSIWMTGKGAAKLDANAFRFSVYAYDPVTHALTPTPLVGTTKLGNGTPNAVSQSFNGPFVGAAYDGKKPVWVMELLAMAGPAWEDVSGTWAAQTQTWAAFGNASAAAGTGWFGITSVYDGKFGDPGITWETTAPVWAGRVTDLVMTPDGAGATRVACTCVDVQAEYAHRFIGDEPWLAEAVDSRVARIATLASIPPVQVSTPKNAWQLTWRDIDNQSSMDLLREIADSVDNVLWLRTGWDGQSLFCEDPAARAALQTLSVVGGLVVITASASSPRTVYLDACDVLADPTVFRQDTENIVSIVDVAWNEQTLDEDGQPAPTERHVVRTDQTAIDAYGTRRLGTSTQLATEVNAGAVADSQIARARDAQWLVPTLVWDTAIGESVTPTESLFQLLDGTLRVAAPISLDNLPPWAPVGETMVCWLEGGRYTYTGGYWELTLAVSPASVAGKPATWQNLRMATDVAVANAPWNKWDTSIDWRDMLTVSVPATVP